MECWELIHSHWFDAKISELGDFPQLDEQLRIASFVLARDPENEDSETGIKDIRMIKTEGDNGDLRIWYRVSDRKKKQVELMYLEPVRRRTNII